MGESNGKIDFIRVGGSQRKKVGTNTNLLYLYYNNVYYTSYFGIRKAICIITFIKCNLNGSTVVLMVKELINN